MIDLELAADIDKLASAIARMRPPQNSNPHAFHEDRSELASQARQLARRCRTGKPIAAADVPAPIVAKLPPGTRVVFAKSIKVDGRTCQVMEVKRWPQRQQAAEHTFY